MGLLGTRNIIAVIPNTAHFIWLGDNLPWIRFLSIPSAITVGGFERGVLHYEPELEQSPIFSEIEKIPHLERRVLNPASLLSTLPTVAGSRLIDIYRELPTPTARANVLRAAILWAEGGVYLDLDTITVGNFTQLRSRCDAFYGVERVIHSPTARVSNRWTCYAQKHLRKLTRSILRQHPQGWRAFRVVENLYPTAANNAVIGAAPGHPFVEQLLTAMIKLPEAQRCVRFALGTHLLQQVANHSTVPNIAILPPNVFYPLGPEISEHWFRHRRKLPSLDKVISPETLVVHWYASVRTKHLMPLINETYVRTHASTQLFSQMVTTLLNGPLQTSANAA